MTTTKNKTILIERTFDLPSNTLWKAWTEEADVIKWWGPKGFTCPYCMINLIEGGKYLSCMKGPDGKEFWSTGTYEEIIPLKKLVYTDSFADSKGNKVPASYYDMPGDWDMELKVAVEFEEAGDKTKLRLTHEGIPAEMYDDCIKGWQESLDKIEPSFK